MMKKLMIMMLLFTTVTVWADGTFTITWKDGDGKTLKTEQVASGETPVYSGDTPTKTATEQYTYTFNDTWYPEIVQATADATYTAQFEATVRKYTVTFVDEDGTTVLKAATDYDYGTAAADIVKPADPTKAATQQYTYTFAGWSPAIAEVTGNATYTATYSSTENPIVAYIDANGRLHDDLTSSTETTEDDGVQAIPLTGTETTLGIADTDTWYVCNSNLTYTTGLTLNGEVHLILADGKTMNVGTSESRINGNGIMYYQYNGGQSLTIYGQIGGTGALNVYVTGDNRSAISAQSVTINGGKVEVTGTYTGISAIDNVTINGGQVTATGSSYGILANSGDIILGWTKPTDYIKANTYCVDVNQAVKTADGKRLVAYNMAHESDISASAIASGTVDDVTLLAGKTLRPLDGNYIEATSGLQIGSLNGKAFTARDADFSIDYAHYYLFSAAAEDVVVYYSKENLPQDYHSIVWNVTGTSLKAYNYFGSGPRNMDNRYATFDMPGNADVTIDYESVGDGRMYQMPGGPLGSDSYWELSEDGSVLILDGTGDITVEKVDEWVNYNIKSISFSESVHYINNEVFAGLTHLETVSIGKNVERIGNGVFAGCTSLTSVTFQDTKVPTIGTDVFPENLTTIIVPAAALQSYYNATSWANYKTLLVASGSCGKTESDHVTWTLTRLATGYEVATAWEDVEPYNPTATTTVPAYKLTISGTGAMADYDGEGVTTPWAAADFHFPAGEWDDSYSDKSVITELEIGAGITALGANAFTGLTNLKSLTIANGTALTTIAPADFAGNHTTVTLPDAVTTIDLKNDPMVLDYAINYAAWHAYHERFTTVGGYCGTTANDADGHNLSWTLEWKGEDADDNGHYPLTLTITGTGAMADYGDSYETQAPWKGFFTILSPLPDGLTSIGNYAFNYGAIRGTLDIPASVTSIGDFAFYHCGLTAVNIPGAKDTEGNALTTIGSSAFEFCESLATVTLGDGIKTIEGGAFQSTCLTAVTIPASVERIDYVAFATDESLKTVTMLGDNPPTLGESTYGSGPFPSSTSLSVILVPNETAYAAYMSAPTWNGTATGDGDNKTDYTHLLAPATITMEGNTSGWSTYCHKYIVSYQVEDGAAYTVSSVSDNTVQTAAAEHVAPYTPTLVYKENGGVVTLTAIAETATQYVPDNYNATTGLVTQSESNFNMLGNATDATITEGGFTEQPFYSLYNGKFYRYEGTQAIAAHRCILTVSPVYTAPVLTIGTETTSLTPIPSPKGEGREYFYTLDGRRLEGKPTQKGIYVNGGRKVVIK